MNQIVLTELNYAEGARYLGYGTSSPDDKVKDIMRECGAQICAGAVPRFVYRTFDLKREPGGLYLDGTDLNLPGTSIREHLEGCDRAVLLCATLSNGIDRLISRTQISDMAKAVVLDAMAGVAVEQVCDKAEKIIREEYKKSGRQGYFTWRFGFGYGDFPLREEAAALRILEAEKKIGVSINESFIMFPRKTAACIIGISDREIPPAKRGCISCAMRDRCKFRIRGEHCGF